MKRLSLKLLLTLEIIKLKRSWVIPIVIFCGLTGGSFGLLDYALRHDFLNNLANPPEQMLYEVFSGFTAMMNLVAFTLLSIMLFQKEYQHNAIQRMLTLPVKGLQLFQAKLLIMIGVNILLLFLQMIEMSVCGFLWLPQGSFSFTPVLQLAVSLFFTSLPVSVLLLICSTVLTNIWQPLGIGFSGILLGIMGGGNHLAGRINPFALTFLSSFTHRIGLRWTDLTFSLLYFLLLLISAMLIFHRKEWGK